MPSIALFLDFNPFSFKTEGFNIAFIGFHNVAYEYLFSLSENWQHIPEAE